MATPDSATPPKNGVVATKTDSSVKLEGRAGKPPSITVHVYHEDRRVAAKQAIDLWFNTYQEVERRWKAAQEDEDE